MYCAKCGEQLKKDAKFCPRCGSQVKTSTDIGRHIRNVKTRKKNSKFRKILLVAVCAGVLLLAGNWVYRKYFENMYLAAVVDQNDKWGFIDEKGQLIIECQYDFAASEWTDGIVAVAKRIGAGENSYLQYGFIDKYGKMVVPFQYDAVSTGNIGDKIIAVAETDSEGESIQKWGFIDTKGNQITEMKYQYENGYFEDGESERDYIIVSETTGRTDADGDCIYNYGVINSKGESVIPMEYQKISGRYSGIAGGGLKNENLICVAKEENGKYKYGYINYDNEEVIAFQYDGATLFADNGLAAVQQGDKWGYIDRYGNTVIDFQYEDAEMFSENGIALVEEEDGTYKYIDVNGETFVSGAWYIPQSFDENGRAAVRAIRAENSTGLFDAQWNQVLPCEYDRIIKQDFGMYLLYIYDEERSYYKISDSEGKLLDGTYDTTGYFGDNGWCSVGKKAGMDEDENAFYDWCYIDKSGKVMLELGQNYQYVRFFSETNPK